MIIEIYLQLFLIFSFFFLIAAIKNLYFRLNGYSNTMKDAVLSSFMLVGLLHVPLFLNYDSSVQLYFSPKRGWILGLLGFVVFSVLYYFYFKLEKDQNFFKNIILAVTNGQTTDSIRQKALTMLEKDKTYSIDDILPLLNTEKSMTERTLNLMALNKEAQIAVIESGELVYCLNHTQKEDQEIPDLAE